MNDLDKAVGWLSLTMIVTAILILLVFLAVSPQ